MLSEDSCFYAYVTQEHNLSSAHVLLLFWKALRIAKPAGSGLLALSWKLRPCTPLFSPPTIQEIKPRDTGRLWEGA